MSKIERIKAEAERLKSELIQEAKKGYKSEFDEGRISSFEDMITFIDSLEEEPISNDLKEAAIEAFKQIVESDKNSFLEIFKSGAEWGMRQAEAKIQAQSTALAHGCPKELTSNDLEEAAHSYVDTTIEWFDSEGNPCCYPAFIAGAQWQKERDQSTIELAEDHAYLAGQEKIIAKAIKWLEDNIDRYLYNTGGYGEYIPKCGGKMFEDFKKAMEK